MYAVVVVVDMEPEVREEFLRLALASVEGARREPGCVQFEVVQPLDNPNRVGFYEVYRDQAAFNEHRAQSYFQAWWEVTRRWQEGGIVRMSAVGGPHLLSEPPDSPPGP